MAGKEIRLRRIFGEDGRTLIVAMDHGIALGPLPGIEDPLEAIRKVVRGGPDALMLNPGILRMASTELAGKAAAIMSVSCGLIDYEVVVEEALRLGADAIKLMVFTHVPGESDNINSLCELAMICDEWGVPLMAEMYPKTENRYKAEVIAKVTRIAAEAGADLVKTFYTGDKESFRRVVESCPIPLVILGGPKVESDE
ncbi:MAG: fructose-bisphosphate aldolase, partial [Thermoproteota archaeon]